MGGFFFLIGFKPIQNIIDLNGLYTKSIVSMTSKVLQAIGIQSSVKGSIIYLPSIALDVRFGCNGLEAVMIYTVAVLSYPARWRMRAVGIIVGFIVIQVLNIIRLVALGYAGVHMKEIFEIVHLYIAQGMMIAVALATFVLYLHYATKREHSQAPA
jgi:exosortase H (IPTLxxWG-CTERM-specific)